MSRVDNNEVATFIASVLRVSEKAMLLKYAPANPDGTPSKPVTKWFPKSQIKKQTVASTEPKDTYEFVVPRWLLDNRTKEVN